MNPDQAFRQVVQHYGFMFAEIGDYGDSKNLKIVLGFPFTVEILPERIQFFHPRDKSILVGFWLRFKIDGLFCDSDMYYEREHYFSLANLTTMKAKWQLKKLNGDKI
jgi:hypothetical protein